MSVSSSRENARAAHAASVERFVAAAGAIPPDRWDRPMRDDKWSPAQVAEHLRMTYALVQNQLSGGSGIRIRTPWLLRTMLRWRILPRILSTGTLPEGARAPREIRPGDGPFEREQTLQALQVAATNVQETLVRRWDDPACQMTHHVFGHLTPPTAMQFATVHTNHHARQLEQVAG